MTASAVLIKIVLTNITFELVLSANLQYGYWHDVFIVIIFSNTTFRYFTI